MLVSNVIDSECLTWAASVANDEACQLLLAGSCRLPVQAILFDTDEKTIETKKRSKKDVQVGLYLAKISSSRGTEHDNLFVALEYASGNMYALEVPSLAYNDYYTRLAFPDGSASVHGTTTDKVGALVAVVRRLDRPGWHPMIIMTVDAKCR